MTLNAQKETIPIEDRTVTLPENVYLALEDMAADLRKKQDNDLIKAMITPKSVAQKLLATETEKYRKTAKGDA